MNKDILIETIKTNLRDNISIDDILRELKNYICLLTRENADLIEDCIGRDPNYQDKMSPIIKKVGVYQNGSSLQVISESLTINELENFVWQVAIGNSIQGKTHSVKTYISKFILNNGQVFYERLRKGDLKLVEEMEAYVYAQGGRIRHECSWCSKVCKFLHDYLFNKDAYYIYDNNVKNRLNDYRRYYHLCQTPLGSIDVYRERNWYTNLCNSLDELKDSLVDRLERFEIDHILWGFTKYNVEVARLH